MSKVIVLVRLRTGRSIDVEVPLDIGADTLISSLHQAMKLPGSAPDSIRSENPIALLHGQAPLSHFGVREGTILYL